MSLKDRYRLPGVMGPAQAEGACGREAGKGDAQNLGPDPKGHFVCSQGV